MNNSKIVPCIWLTADGGLLSKVLGYYQTVFSNNFRKGQITALGQTPSGNAEMCEIELFGQKYSIINTEYEHHPLNEAVSFMIKCEGQREIDHFWNYLTKDGKESQCGWCSDKYGVSWQVVPTNFGELMSKPNSSQVMMKQKKIVIAEYLQ